jgi:hypothetical protein
LGDWQITSFDDLLAHLDGLLEAAWNADVDPRLARQLATIRHRLVRLQGHLQGQGNPGHPAPRPHRKTLRANDDLIQQFGEVAEAARAGRALPMTLSHYLHNARQRLHFFLRSPDHRLTRRQVPESGASAILELNGQRQEVAVVDRSPFGVGVRADSAVETDQVAQLHCPDKPEGAKTFECLTVHCRKRKDGYHVGLEIFTAKR